MSRWAPASQTSTIQPWRPSRPAAGTGFFSTFVWGSRRGAEGAERVRLPRRRLAPHEGHAKPPSREEGARQRRAPLPPAFAGRPVPFCAPPPRLRVNPLLPTISGGRILVTRRRGGAEALHVGQWRGFPRKETAAGAGCGHASRAPTPRSATSARTDRLRVSRPARIRISRSAPPPQSSAPRRRSASGSSHAVPCAAARNGRSPGWRGCWR